MSRYQRHVLLQALIVVSGWFSLYYGWGLRVENWAVLIVWGLSLSVMLVPFQGWVLRGKNNDKKEK